MVPEQGVIDMAAVQRYHDIFDCIERLVDDVPCVSAKYCLIMMSHSSATVRLCASYGMLVGCKLGTRKLSAVSKPLATYNSCWLTWYKMSWLLTASSCGRGLHEA